MIVPGMELEYTLRTPDMEINNVLHSLNIQIKFLAIGDEAKKRNYATEFYNNLILKYNSGVSLTEIHDAICKMTQVPDAHSKEFWDSVNFACFYCVEAYLYTRSGESGNNIRVWQALCSAWRYAGCALSVFVGSSEVRHQKRKQSSRGGKARDEAENEPSRKVLREWIDENHEKYVDVSVMAKNIFSMKVVIEKESTIVKWANEYVTNIGIRWLDKNSKKDTDKEVLIKELFRAKVAPIKKIKARHIVKKWIGQG